MKRIKNIINKICAMPAAAPAMPVKPKRPAIIAMTKKESDHPSISILPIYQVIMAAAKNYSSGMC
jgi:hypothetical protein